jgi:hypothetical protein
VPIPGAFGNNNHGPCFLTVFFKFFFIPSPLAKEGNNSGNEDDVEEKCILSKLVVTRARRKSPKLKKHENKEKCHAKIARCAKETINIPD